MITEYEGFEQFIGKEDIFINCDCLEALKKMPNKCIDLAVVDPPYGGGGQNNENTSWTEQRHQRGRSKKYAINDSEESIGLAGGGGEYRGAICGRFGGQFKKYFDNDIDVERRGGQWAAKYGNNIQHWDIAPPEEYFKELARVSKNQIIWGGNYFCLPATRCFLIWEKFIPENFSMAMCEYAWTSFNDNAKIFKYAPQGKAGDPRFHPTQKPIELYEWILGKYAKTGDIILDTHTGSASSLIACQRMGFKHVGFEISPYYYEKSLERIKRETAQISLFDFGYNPYQE